MASQETEAARYAAEALRQTGLEPTTETFRSARSNWRPYALYAGLILASAAFFLFWMRRQMELFIGMDYERGLKMLKEWIETGQILSTT